MGSSFETTTIEAGSESELRSQYREYIEEQLFLHGHDTYSGTLATCNGLRISAQRFTRVDTACDYIMEHATKGDEAIAVRLDLPGKSFYEAKPSRHDSLKKAENDTYLAAASIRNELLKRLHSQSAKTRKCDKCGSSIAVTYLQSLDCPVCRATFFCVSDTDRKRIARVDAKREAARKALADEQRAYDAAAPKKAVWLIGGWTVS